MNKPLLLLDVDGVLCPFGCQEDPEGYFPFQVGHSYSNLLVWISHHNTDRLRKLQEYFEVNWCTAWEHHANEILGPQHDLMILPTIEFASKHITKEAIDAHPCWPEQRFGDVKDGVASWKLPWIALWTRDRPFAWIDDDIRSDAFKWAERRDVPTLFVRTDPAVGMTDEHVNELITWAQEILNGAEETDGDGD